MNTDLSLTLLLLCPRPYHGRRNILLSRVVVIGIDKTNFAA